MSQLIRNPRSGEQGNSIVEFALVSVFLVPLLIGTFTIGMGLNRSLGVASFTRDIGAMFVTNSVDFSQSGAQTIAVRLANGLGLDNTGNTGYTGGTSGTGEVILSGVLRVGTRECNTLSTTALQNSCKTEIGNDTIERYVFLRRIIIGNNTRGASYFGAPTCAQNSDGTIPSSSYMTLPLSTNCAAINATTFSGVLALQPSENTYIVETHFDAPELNVFKLDGTMTPTHFYVRNLF